MRTTSRPSSSCCANCNLQQRTSTHAGEVSCTAHYGLQRRDIRFQKVTVQQLSIYHTSISPHNSVGTKQHCKEDLPSCCIPSNEIVERCTGRRKQTLALGVQEYGSERQTHTHTHTHTRTRTPRVRRNVDANFQSMSRERDERARVCACPHEQQTDNNVHKRASEQARER